MRMERKVRIMGIEGNDRGDDEGTTSSLTTSSLGDSSSQELAIWFAMGCRCR